MKVDSLEYIYQLSLKCINWIIKGMLEFPSSRTLENEHYYGKEDFKVGKTVKILEKEWVGLQI